MTREDYLDDSAVKQFIEWLRPHILGEDSFPHQYQMLRPRRRWRCDSLWGAFENYEWRGQGFKANQETLDDFADRLRRAVGCDDSGGFVKSAIDVLRWGGVAAKNKKTLCQLGDAALPEFLEDRRLLDPSCADTSNLAVHRMDSGWTKSMRCCSTTFRCTTGASARPWAI